jgi:hypothetical protein
MHASMDIQQAFGCGLVAATSTLARVSLREAKHIPTSSTKSMHALFSLLSILLSQHVIAVA